MATVRSISFTPATRYYTSTHSCPYPPAPVVRRPAREPGPDIGECTASGGAGDYEYLALFRELVQPLAREFARSSFSCPQASTFTTMIRSVACGSRRKAPPASPACSWIQPPKLCGESTAVLEGGYSLEGLRDSVKQVLLELSGASPVSSAAPKAAAGYGVFDTVIRKVEDAFTGGPLEYASRRRSR